LAVLVLPARAAAVPEPQEGRTSARQEGEVVTEEGEDEDDDQPTSRFEEQMTVAASRIEGRVLDAPVSVSIITADELERRRGESLGDVLSTIPGVNLIQWGARDLSINIRAATQAADPYVLPLVDGRSLYSDSFGLVTWESVPVWYDEIEQVEVIRGPASAVWGANAMNGVIQFVTRPPSELAGTTKVRLGGGEVGTLMAGFLHAAQLSEEWSWKASAGWFEQDAWERDSGALPGGGVIPPFPDDGTSQFKADLQFERRRAGGGELRFGAGASQLNGLLFGGAGPADVDSGSYHAYANMIYEEDRTRWQVFVNSFSVDTKSLLSTLDFEADTLQIDASVQSHRFVGDHHLLFGGNVRLNNFDITVVPDEDQRHESGAFLEDQWALSDRVVLTLGGRLDWNETYGTVFSPRTSLLFYNRPGQTLRLAFNRAYRSPSFATNYWNSTQDFTVDLGPLGPFTWPILSIGNEDLEVEELTAVEVGWSAVWKNRAMTTLSIFRNDIEDYIVFVPADFYSPVDPPPGWPLPPVTVPPFTFPRTLTWVNGGESEQVGAELTVDVSLSEAWLLDFQWTWLDEPEVDSAETGLSLNVPPEHRASASLQFVGEQIFGSMGVNYQDEAFWGDVFAPQFVGYTDSFTSVSASVGYRVRKDTTIQVRGSNLLDEDIQYHLWGDVIGRRITMEIIHELRSRGGSGDVL
jgi:iron complex outermembrane receptor protein